MGGRGKERMAWRWDEVKRAGRLGAGGWWSRSQEACPVGEVVWLGLATEHPGVLIASSASKGWGASPGGDTALGMLTQSAHEAGKQREQSVFLHNPEHIVPLYTASGCYG